MKRAARILIAAIIATSAPKAHRGFAEIDAGLAVRAIVGEARGEGYRGMLAVAQGLRNRARHPYYARRPFHGIYGLKARINDRVSPELYQDAKRAWEAAKRANVVGRATVWGNARDVRKFKKQRWFKNYRLVRQIGRHYFFEER